jgi:sensor histidine kinase YesM
MIDVAILHSHVRVVALIAAIARLWRRDWAVFLDEEVEVALRVSLADSHLDSFIWQKGTEVHIVIVLSVHESACLFEVDVEVVVMLGLGSLVVVVVVVMIMLCLSITILLLFIIIFSFSIILSSIWILGIAGVDNDGDDW